MSGKRPGKKPAKKKPVDHEAVAAKKERREKAQALRAEQLRKARRRSLFKQVGIVAVVALVAIGIAAAVLMNRKVDHVAAPPGFDEDGGISVGAEDAPVTVRMVEDFSCPHCADTEADNRDLLTSYAEGKDVRIDYHPIAFLDGHSSDEYATRSLNAAVCVVEQDPKNWAAIHESLMENQPEMGGDGLSDDRLVELSTEAGADRDTVKKCIDDRAHEDWIEYTTYRAQEEDDFAGTPAVYVNGKRLDDLSPDAIDAAVQEQLAG